MRLVLIAQNSSRRRPWRARFFLRRLCCRGPPRPGAAIPQGSEDALQEAFQTQGFWLLTIGFFVCGFHVTFIGLHLPSYISDKAVGMSFFGTPVSALELGGWAIGLVGLFNIAGSLIWGWLGSQYPKKDMLALLYALRALAFVMFLALPQEAPSRPIPTINAGTSRTS